MALEWADSMDGVDWADLSALYKVAPLGDKPAENLMRERGYLDD